MSYKVKCILYYVYSVSQFNLFSSEYPQNSEFSSHNDPSMNIPHIRSSVIHTMNIFYTKYPRNKWKFEVLTSSMDRDRRNGRTLPSLERSGDHISNDKKFYWLRSLSPTLLSPLMLNDKQFSLALTFVIFERIRKDFVGITQVTN